MQWNLSEEQELMRKTARDMVAQKSPVNRVRQLRDKADETGFSRDLWKEMAELGWVGVSFPEEHGGAGLGFMDLCLILEETGRELVPEPFLSTVLLGAQVLLESGDASHIDSWMGPIIAGERILTLAHQEKFSRYNPCDVQAKAEPSAGGFVLSGEKIQVLDGHVADGFVVSLRTRGSRKHRDGVSLFMVDTNTEGVQVTRQVRVDGRNAAIVQFDNVAVAKDALIGELHQGMDILEPVLDRACIGLSAEMLGAASQAFELTLAYLKERKQFGVPIGSFQALQHRATRLFCDLEMCRSAVAAAVNAVDSAPERVSAMASLAKAKCSELFLQVSEEGVQMHGGVGVTDEYDIGLYLKRARAAANTLGDVSYHQERWADLHGY